MSVLFVTAGASEASVAAAHAYMEARRAPVYSHHALEAELDVGGSGIECTAHNSVGGMALPACRRVAITYGLCGGR